MRKFICFTIILILFLSMLGALTGCQKGIQMEFMPNTEEIDYAIIHDPSVFYDEVSGKYYAFGSHFAVASSEDLISWKQEVNEYEPEKLYGTKDFRSILLKSTDFNGRDGGINSTWAPDVIKYGDTYYMYYALTSAFGKGKSCIGRVSSKNILGPYSNEEVFIYSNDLWWEEPNAIDPELFYDKNGKLWMVYGSYFAGIYVIELHNGGENFGRPVEKGFGKKICWGGYSSGVEGPFIFYSQETDYFYLMISEGNLNSNYNMRIARSKNPDGPYLDYSGFDMLTPEGKGNKLSSNYRYYNELVGHVALGHNSVIKKDGEYFCIFHERKSHLNTITNSYNIRTRKLLFNKDGWPVLAPNNYMGEKTYSIRKGDIIGEYDFILHDERTVDDILISDRYTLSPTGAIIKNREKVGTYSYSNGYLDFNIGGVKYSGVAVYNYVDYLGYSTISMSLISKDGLIPIMGNKIMEQL